MIVYYVHVKSKTKSKTAQVSIKTIEDYASRVLLAPTVLIVATHEPEIID